MMVVGLWEIGLIGGTGFVLVVMAAASAFAITVLVKGGWR